MIEVNQKTISVRVPEDLLKALDKYLQREYRGAVNRSAYISMIVRADLKNNKVKL